MNLTLLGSKLILITLSGSKILKFRDYYGWTVPSKVTKSVNSDDEEKMNGSLAMCSALNLFILMAVSPLPTWIYWSPGLAWVQSKRLCLFYNCVLENLFFRKYIWFPTFILLMFWTQFCFIPNLRLKSKINFCA